MPINNKKKLNSEFTNQNLKQVLLNQNYLNLVKTCFE